MTHPLRSGDEPAAPVEETRRDKPPAPSSAVPHESPPTASFPAGPVGNPNLPNPFGRYVLQHPLGRGGMGAVYLARDTHLDRLVALKVPQFEGSDPPLLRERFFREARAAAILHHPNICPVFDVGEVGTFPYLTMAYIEGQTLHQWASAGPPQPLARVVEVVRKLARALEEAHRRGVVHRDLKPSNVMVDLRGEPVVMDFGLARRLHLPEDRLTREGMLVGTPAYMAPEQVLNRPGAQGPHGDVYSLGVILYELLTGRTPFQGSMTALVAQVVLDEPVPPGQLRPGLDAPLEAVCLHALAKDPSRRLESMAEFARRLEAWSPGSAPPTVPLRQQASAPQPSPAGPSSAPEDPDPRLAPKVLALLRKWGWAQGLQKVRTRASRTQNERQRASWQGLLDWLAGERTAAARAVASFQALPEGTALRGWALAGQASLLVRNRDYTGAQRLLERAESQGDRADTILAATIAHTRGAAWLHLGKPEQALPQLHRALTLLGRDHFLTGRVLDTLGMVYAAKGHFPVAREFYDHALRHKQARDDEAGLAVTHGQLGRLYLDWGQLDLAEKHFQEDLRLAQKMRSRWSEAQMYNHLGQVAAARAEREAAGGRKGSARRYRVEAAGWLDTSIRHCQEGQWPVAEGFARKDRALVHLQEGELAQAEQQARQAAEAFQAVPFPEGLAQVQRVEGMILRARERWEEADRKVRAALAHFDATQERDEAARVQGEIARTLRAQGAAAPLVTRAFREALGRAEACRQAALVQQVEEELREVDPEAYLRHVYRRARGHGLEDDSASLLAGALEEVTVLLLDLPGFPEYARNLDPEAVLLTFNQLMADFAEILAPHRAPVTAYRGDGLMALVRESRHAERAVRAALDLVAALEEFNGPRRVLDLPLIQARVALHTGDAYLGNVGTYHKMDFTALGSTVNQAAALLTAAQPGLPCVSRATYERVRDRFTFGADGPRTVAPVGFDPFEVWDVTGLSGN